MANSTYGMDEIRLNVADPDRTDVYVYLSPGVDCPHFVAGWHYKAYPARMTTLEIHSLLCTTADHDPVMWPRKAPPDVASSEAGQLAHALLTWDMGMDPTQPGWSRWEALRMLAESVVGERRFG
jgi:hypothetical protein